MWLIFDTVADCAKFVASAVEFGGKDPQKGVAGTVDGTKKIILDVQSLTNPPDPITVNVAFDDTQATAATSGAAWAQVRALQAMQGPCKWAAGLHSSTAPCTLQLHCHTTRS